MNLVAARLANVCHSAKVGLQPVVASQLILTRASSVSFQQHQATADMSANGVANGHAAKKQKTEQTSLHDEHNVVLVLDYGSQYTQLICRRIREIGVFSMMFPGDASMVGFVYWSSSHQHLPCEIVSRVQHGCLLLRQSRKRS